MTQVQEKFEKLNSRSEMEIQFEDHFSENKEYLVRFKLIGEKTKFPTLPRQKWNVKSKEDESQTLNLMFQMA